MLRKLEDLGVIEHKACDDAALAQPLSPTREQQKAIDHVPLPPNRGFLLEG